MGFAIYSRDNDFSQNNLGEITPIEFVELIGFTILGQSSVVGTSAEYSVEYSPSNTTQKGVTWSVESGGAYATINASTGVLTILSGANDSTVVIRATSNKVTNYYVEKSIQVTWAMPPVVIDYPTLLTYNQTSWRGIQRPADYLIDGWDYYYIKVSQGSVGDDISVVKGSGQEHGMWQTWKIPVPEGATKVNAVIFASTSGYGFCFTDNSDKLTGTYINTDQSKATTYQDIAIPSGSKYFWYEIGGNAYRTYGSDLVVTFS